MSLTVIELENMEFQAFHGCYELERQVGNRFLVSVRIEAELGEAADSDRIERTINYLDVFETVREPDGHSVAHSRTRRQEGSPAASAEPVSAKRPGSGQGLENGPSSGRENRESLGNSRKIKGGERVLITS